MIGLIASILFIIWFFNSAKKVGKNPWGWAIAGFLSYYIPAFIWGIILGLISSKIDIRISSSSEAIIYGLVVGLSSVLVGSICAALVRTQILLKTHQETTISTTEETETIPDSKEIGSV